MSFRVPVTDRALVRYLERVHGLPVEEVREQIATRLAEELEGEQAESRSVALDGFLFHVRRGQLVAVSSAQASKKASGLKAGRR